MKPYSRLLFSIYQIQKDLQNRELPKMSTSAQGNVTAVMKKVTEAMNPPSLFPVHEIDDYSIAAEKKEGFIFRRINTGNKVVSDKTIPRAIRDVVNFYSKLIGITVAPQDLRWTCDLPIWMGHI
jgi:hypothetical protein